ncbi:hypothetical protein [Pimelobacter sp. 30-1]|uniref:COG4315 family predicted lipoprotein n=1 Tax=Pimelobacter sp. 30-1 TaxID=2004991 RepID=UPI001C05687E|nr:hypothetical protein [Pimelobacter sp. 30-1]MBU2695807.1 hypothetical protein [Pimelobacter sp. 30-1]
MNKPAALATSLLTATVLALGGCGSDGGGGSGGDTTPTASNLTLRLADTEVGKVLVDAAGRTVYFYDKDQPGATASACTGPCVGLWPAVPAPAKPSLGPGVQGTLGTVTGADGKDQLTLEGHPLYTYASDGEAGDAYGQGYGGIWWVVGADGAKVTTPAAPSSPSSPSSPSDPSSGGGGGYGY